MKKRNIWTTVTGGLLAALGVTQTISSGGIITPENISSIIAGIGLLFARDGKVIKKED